MKKLFLLLILAASISAKSQVSTLYYKEHISRSVEFRDSIMNALPGFKYSGLDSAYQYGNTYYAFHFIDAEKNEVILQFMKDSVYICNVKIAGPFDPLFQIWKRYFDANADKKNLKSIGFIRFIKFDQEDWVIM